jgi:tetratricopeptide (TPR) repeat protein
MSRTCVATQITHAITNTALSLVVLLTAVAASAGNKPDDWIEVRSPHFVVATNSNEKQGRRVADQFERMRSVFHAAFPKLQIDVGAPIIVLACKDETSFRALEPESYLAKGQVKLGGLFARALDKNYVLLRLDAEGEHPYAVVYHEYTHLLMGKSAEWVPLWMNEGLAEFYQTTEIQQKDVLLGQPNRENLALLRQSRLLPLTTLFTVDAKSPYYHEEYKGNIFYAESWALMHYIEIKDRQDGAARLRNYGDLVSKGGDPVAAATTAFGDLNKLQDELQRYVEGSRYTYFKMATITEIDDSAFQVTPLSAVQADALRADFMAYDRRTADARALLNHVLQEDPNNAAACETMGMLAFSEGNLQEAGKWYRQAVQLNSQSYLANYYAAAIAMNEKQGAVGESQDEAQIEASLRTAIKLNPAFAPPYDRLAALLGMGRRNLDEARMMELNAIALDPEDVGFRINMANILLEMKQGDNAVKVLQMAAKVAKKPVETFAVETMLKRAQAYAEAQQDERDEMDDEDNPEVAAQGSVEKVDAPEPLHPETFVAKGPHRFLTGTLKNVHCAMSQLDLTVVAAGKTLTLHSENSYKIQFTALGFTPKGDLNPCQDLEGRPAKVEYVESADESSAARVLSIELHK